MKAYTKITRADLEQAPIWEWVPEDESGEPDGDADESHVRPTSLREIPVGAFAQFIVAATIEMKSGHRYPGIAEVTTDHSTVVVQPTTVFLLDRHLPIPGVETNRLLTRHTASMENHPAGWRLSVPVDGESEPRSGAILHGDMKQIVEMGMQALLALKGLRGERN